MKCLIILMRDQRFEIDDPNANKASYNYNIPIGLAYISAVLKENNHQVEALNLNHLNGTVDEIMQNELSKKKYDVVLTGGLSPFYPNIKKIVDYVRKFAPDIKIILGGGLISAQPEIMFGLLEPDYGVIGEGEVTIKELFHFLQNGGERKEIDGIIFRDTDGQIFKTKPRDPIRNLDVLPWPDYEGFGFEENLAHMYPSDGAYYDVVDYPRMYPMITSRSCPYVCTFCYHPLGNKYRQRSLDNIMEEIKYAVHKYNINLLFFYDELFAHDKERVHELCSRIKEFSSTLPWELKWFCQMRVDSLEEDVVKEMKDAGCFYFSLGLESYSAPILKSMKKKITPQQIDSALRLCKKIGIGYTGNFIFGDIKETKETYRETLDYWTSNRDLCECRIGLCLINIYQGSYIYEYALKKGIIKDEVQFIQDRAKRFDAYLDPINFTEAMTDEEFKQMIIDYKQASAIVKYTVTPLKDIPTGDVHELHIKCPFCGEISIYKNFKFSEDVARTEISCRKCRARYTIPGKRLRLKLLLVKLFGYRTPYRIAKFVYDASDYLPVSMNVKIKKMLEV